MFLSELVITGNLSKIMIFRIFVEMKNCEIEGWIEGIDFLREKILQEGRSPVDFKITISNRFVTIRIVTIDQW